VVFNNILCFQKDVVKRRILFSFFFFLLALQMIICKIKIMLKS